MGVQQWILDWRADERWYISMFGTGAKVWVEAIFSAFVAAPITLIIYGTVLLAGSQLPFGSNDPVTLWFLMTVGTYSAAINCKLTEEL